MGTAHALFPFRKCIGCEINAEIVSRACGIAECYVQSGLARHASAKGEARDLNIQADFIHDLDWREASVAFANAITFPKQLLRLIARQALRLRPGAVLIVAAGQLPLDDPTLLKAFDMRGE